MDFQANISSSLSGAKANCQRSMTLSEDSKKIEQARLSILISGAGIAGLALANALVNLNQELEPDQRISFLVVERDDSSNSRNQGYGLTILRDNVVYLQKPNVLPNISERLVTLTGGYKSYTHEGELLSVDLKTDPSQFKKIVARGEIRDSFLDRVGRINILWNTVVQSFRETDDGVLVSLNSNGEEKTLLVANLIAADGVNSKIRNLVVKDSKQYLGVVGVFGRVANEQAQEHLKHEFQIDDLTGWRMFSKPYSVEQYNWQIFFPWNENKELPDNRSMLDHVVSELFTKGWKREYIDLVGSTKPDTLRSGLLYDRVPLAPLEGSGAITFIGDAAHPVSPYKGRGANLALEGVQVFVHVLKESIEMAAKEGKTVDFAKVNRTYEAKHWPNAGKVQLACRQSVMEHHFAGSKRN